MSSGHLSAVRFPDGRVMFTTYSGTSDVLQSDLHDTIDEAAEAYRSPTWPADPCPCDLLVVLHVVQVWTLYGGGFGWEAEACPHRVRLGAMPYGCEDQSGRMLEPVRPMVEAPWPWVADVFGT